MAAEKLLELDPSLISPEVYKYELCNNVTVF